MENVMWGYARVSSSGQNLDRQLNALKEYGVEERYIKSEHLSGADFNRPEFLSLVGTDTVAPSMREGDCLVILSLDRLGRNYQEIRKWWQYITVELKCDIVVLDMPLLDTRNTNNSSLDRRFISDLVLQILSYVSERERISIKVRQRQGIEAAKAKGVKFGRKTVPKPENFSEVAARWHNGEITAVQAMKELKITKNIFYKYIKTEVFDD